MEYNYTREFKQKHKIYSFGKYPIPFARNGVTLEALTLFAVIVGFFIVLAIIAFVKKISFLKTIFSSAYMIILFFIVVFVWVIFSLKWDNKSIPQYLKGRIGFLKSRRVQTEHGHRTVLLGQSVHYKRQKGGVMRAIKTNKNK